MQIVIAPDSFKGSMSQVTIAEAMERAIRNVLPDATCVQKPMADGGDGMLASCMRGREDVRVHVINVTGPRGEQRTAQIGITDDRVAMIEMAMIAGIDLVPPLKRNPAEMTTFGIGEAMRYALDQGVQEIVIGLGGSATNDGGIGMLQALGATFQGEKISGDDYLYGKDLAVIETVDLSTIDERLAGTRIRIASDVTNPLCGPEGATCIFAPQKGAKKDTLLAVDQQMERYVQVIQGTDLAPEQLAREAGSGAAGGLGFALLLLRGKIEQGAKVVAQMIRLDEALASADIVITGEGKTDDQTKRGKAPFYVATRAKHFSVRTILLSGKIEEAGWMHAYFDEMHALVSRDGSAKRAFQETEAVVTEHIHTIFRRMKNR